MYRFDVADRHGYLPMLPAHKHTSLPKDNSEVSSGLLNGIWLVDTARLRELLDQLGG